MLLNICKKFAVSSFFLFLPTGLFAYSTPDTTQYTFGPVLDYRSSHQVDYKSLHLVGPVLKFDNKADEFELGLRPLFYHSAAPKRDASLTEVVFPILEYKRDKNIRSFSILRLVNFESGRQKKEKTREFSIFPLVFYRQRADQPTSVAVVPFWGHLYNRFGRDEIAYTLWPLYVKTRRQQTQVRNYLWPFFATVSGEKPDERGFKFWPLFGRATNPGVYRKFFLLWPFWFDYDEQLDTDRPVAKRYLFPLYLYRESPQLSRRTFLWPFFSYLDDRNKGYTEWNYPWPFWQRAQGEFKHGWKFLPFASDMTRNDIRVRWYLWPLLKHETQRYENMVRRKTKLFFFVYRDLKETFIEPEAERYRRILFWPLFGFERDKGVSHFYSLALIEPLAPDSEGVQRNWAPLWRIYQKKWDRHGNSVTSILWNLYWSEHRSDAVAWELFPLFSWRDEKRARSWSFLKGLVGYQRDGMGRRLKLLYIPWGIPLGDGKDVPVN